MRQLLRSQDGVALPVASGMLLVISLLVVGFFTVSLRVNDTSVEDRSSKRALAAAEAGLQIAVYRLNQLNGTDEAIREASCLTGTPTPTWEEPTAGECPAVHEDESLGNGAEYTYYVTHEGGAAGCVEHPDIPATDDDRCITSTGTVNDVIRRVQARVISRPLVPNFGSTGLVGKSLVYAWNSINLTTNVGSNELVKFENSVNVHDNPALGVDGSIMLLTGGEYDEGNGVNVDGNGGNPVEVTVPFDMPVPNFEPVEISNNNDLLPDSVFEGGALERHKRRFKLGNSATYTFSPGTYHFCNVELGNSVNLRFTHAGGQPTRIFVDSPSREGSVCEGQADPSGTFGADNSVRINVDVGQREELLEVYLYGSDQEDTRNAYTWCSDLNGGGLDGECKSDFMLDNSVQFYGSVYAPRSSVQAHNSVTITGSIAGDKIRFYNSITFNLTNPAISDRIIPASAAERKGWTECQSQPAVSTDPESGC